MELARYVVDAVVLEGRSYRDVAHTRRVEELGWKDPPPAPRWRLRGDVPGDVVERRVSASRPTFREVSERRSVVGWAQVA